MELNSIAFIPDGNRRYSEKANISLLESYQVGTQKAWKVMDWLMAYPKIKTGTFYTLSLENTRRKSAELKVLFSIFDNELDKVMEGNFFKEKQIKLNFIGRLHLLPKKLQEKLSEAEEFTQNFKAKTINLAIGYNGQAEIVDATKKIAELYKQNKINLEKLNPKNYYNYLYNSLVPDLIIRTSGTQRLSGFLTYASSYSELHFCKKTWPEFSQQDLRNAVQEFNSRERKYGL